MRYLILPSLFLLLASASWAGDWLTLPSTYTHDLNGQRVIQHQQIAAPTAPMANNFRSSGYTNTRSSLNFGSSADHYHRVEKWGDPVRPYGEWRFPYRPFSTPYPNWGAPYAGLNIGLGGFGGPRGGYGNPYPGQPFGNGNAVGNGSTHPQVPPQPPNARDRWPSDANLFQPYPAGPGTPYPVAPYYDGFQPTYRD